ncbi:glycerol-3-phosphate dehydrogenase subunit GlpB [Halodesulfovibrio spirochaetisodalis]|nr:glycerol-3-phosphate dehydrogenase subunit GlpB [Halodesulfovibrio spirochaetisodalis]
MSTMPVTERDLFVVGTGIAGMSAAVYAAKRGLSVCQAGSTGEIVFSSGLFDVMGVHPVAEKKLWENPWEAMAAVAADMPDHPYAHVTREEVEKAYGELFDFLSEFGLEYRMVKDANSKVVTPIGTEKTTWAVPATMWAGVEAFKNNTPALLIDFEGLREFSAKQVATTLGDKWSNLKTMRIEFPDSASMKPILTGIMAQAMELKETREKLYSLIKPHLDGVEAVGVPAILGLYTPGEILEEMEKELGVKVFELPTLPASVPGMRLKSLFEGRISTLGVDLKLQHKVFSITPLNDGRYEVTFGVQAPTEKVVAKGVVLATGRFLGGGLFADRHHIVETVMNLPVSQPADREEWHRTDLLDPRGHKVSSAGVEVDSSFRPVDENGEVVHERVYAVGSLLAHQDWMRMKCGTGIAVASSLRAVEAFVAQQ